MNNRLKFILNTSAEYFGCAPSPPDANNTEWDEHTAYILEFLENDEHTVIAACRSPADGNKIKFHHRIPNDEVCLLFYKIPQVGPATQQHRSNRGNGMRHDATNGSDDGGGGPVRTMPTDQKQHPQPLGMLTLEGGLVKSIYNSVSRVFSPQAEARKAEYSPELSGLLENLHVSLGSTLGLPQSGISSVKDEIKYWKQKLNSKASTRIDRETSQVFLGVLESIDSQMRGLDTSHSIEEFLDQAHNNLDELWRLPYQYPQNRMADLLDTIGNLLLELCVDQLSGEDIWDIHSAHVNSLMSQCLDTVDSWIQLCDSLTRLFWPNYVQHPWLGEPHTPKRGQQFKERLAEIRNIKSLYKQIATLLDEQEVKSMFYENSPFKEFNILDTSAMGQTKWNKALQYFEQILQPIDERIATAIKGQLHHHLSNPRQVIFIFSKYETLIQRPTVLELLTIEREQFLQSLHILLQDLRRAMTDTNMEPDTGHLSVICNECRWLKIVQHQIHEIEKVSHLISGRDGFEKINKAVQEIKEETESLLRTNFEIWCGQCSTAVKSGELKLRDDQAVVKFEKEGRQLMRVTFNPKLVTFCQDVREFENLGYSVPPELRSAASHASKFMCYARRLQQIATFHNTIGDRMIPCQRPIMLKNAMELSKLVQSETVAWQDEESVQRYVNMLQTAVSKLASDNSLLVGYHDQAKRTVIKLMNTDLFTQNQVWKDEMRHLRELVATLERLGYSNLNAFKLHWDHQLYKVLEYQYIYGLVDMNNKLPDIHVDILYRQRQLCYRPPEEEIREKYFTQLRRFIERPSSFRGLSENGGELFKSMVEVNRKYFGPLFEKAEELFRKLEEFKRIWSPWVALGSVDMEELCSIHLNSAEDWDRNFRACKNFSQKIAKIQNTEESIDCIVINISPLRSDIELIGRRYWEALTNSLRTSIIDDVTFIQEFLQSSLQFLNNVPMDETSITESGMKYEKMMSDLPKVSERLALVKNKDTCLAGWCKERVTSLAGILTQWEKLQPLIENHAVVLQRQVVLIKEQAATQIQNLREEAEKLQLRWESTIAELEANEQTTLELFKERRDHWQRIQSKKQRLLDECSTFNMEFPDDIVATFAAIDSQIQSQSQQWEVYDTYLQEFKAIRDEEWTIFRRRPYVLNEFLAKWDSAVHSSIDLPSKRIRQSVEQLHSVMPVLQQLQSDSLNERHWANIFVLLKKSQMKPLHSILVEDILQDCNLLMQAANDIAAVVRQAASEQIVRQALTELDQWSVMANLKLFAHKDSGGHEVSLIKDYQEVLTKIGDNQSLLQSAKNSAAFEAFSDQAELWESRLNTLDTLLSSLSQSQRRWIYLEPVFGAGTLRNEEALFKRIDKDFRYVMREVQMDPRVVSLIKINNISTIVSSLETQLARCQNNLMSYIMEKRNSFPRFYFLGDDDLLELLGQAAKDSEVVQKHIRKLFPGIHTLGIEGSTIKTVNSAEGDVLQLRRPIQIDGAIELWLNNLMLSIQDTLRQQIVECHQALGASQLFTEQLVGRYPIQVLSTARAIHHTQMTERHIKSMSLKKLHQALGDEIQQYTVMKNGSTEPLIRLKLRSLLLDLVHYATVIEELMQHNVMHDTDWHWLGQLKFYLQPAGGGGASGGGASSTSAGVVVCRMVYAQFEYSYEFLGNPNKLVGTSLTHKCYLILTQAMHMGLGGNPFGPAGTGKTESVKALGAMLGRLVLVFNCDENVDTESMALILTGLARCGAWGCFDEFNRLQEATLSAISMLIQPIQMALKDKAAAVQIGDKQIKLDHHCGIFVTLNPAGAEYGGRQKLPGNIQALFRPIVMQQPEPRAISRVLLFVEGFRGAGEIAERIVELFELSGRMLSQQRHYDWGLRELKTVLLACGEAWRRHHHPDNSNEGGEVDELAVVVRCLRSSTMSKLMLHDVARFELLLERVFPEVADSPAVATAMQQAVREAFPALGLCPNARQAEKAVQLHEQLAKRMGVVIVGPPGCGKSSVIAVLRQALTAAGTATTATQIRVHTISPKSMSRVQLLGHLDPDTRQWHDGVLTNIAVQVNGEATTASGGEQQHHQLRSWIVCDGSIDPEWIEALNSVLDDNKLLTLPSGWRIQFGDNVNFIFETDDVRHASPATISRMGIVYMNKEDFPQKEILEVAVNKEEFGDLLRSYIEELFIPAVEWVEREYLHILPALSRSNLQRSLLLQLQGGVNSRDEFCLAVCRALFGFLPTQRHADFAQWLFDKANIYLANPQRVEYAYYNQQRCSVDFYESDTQRHEDHELSLTAAVKSYLDILHSFLKAPPAASPFLVVGPSGGGKTLLLQHALQEHSGYEMVTVNCSAQLTPAYITHCLRQNCITVSGLRGREYKAKQVRLVLFMKNLDLCHVDSWGSSEVVEFLLQLVQRQGFYATNSLEWINVSGVQVCGSIGPATASLLKISPRFMGMNHFLRVAYPSDSDMLTIFGNHLEPLLMAGRFKGSAAGNTQYIVEGLMQLFTKIQASLSCSPGRGHYQFSPKFIMKLLDNLKYYPENAFNEALNTEIQSIFKDRLVSEEDVDTFDTILRQCLRKLCGKDKVYFVPKTPKHGSELQALLHDEWLEEIQRQITICNAENFVVDEPITKELIEQTAKISRLLVRPETHLLLIGQAGGRQLDALYAAATMQQAKVVSLQGGPNYSLTDFYNDLKLAMQAAALEDLCVCLVVDHCWLSFVPDIMKPIEAILEGSEILDLFGDDLESIANSLKHSAQLEGFTESIGSYFMKRASRNLHLVVSLDPSNPKIDDYFNKFPALHRSMEILYVRPSSSETMAMVPKKFIEMLGGEGNTKVAVPTNFAGILENLIPLQTPERFYQLIRSYFHIYANFAEEIQKRLQKLQLGVDKLSSAHAVVDTLKSNALQQEEALAEKRKLANEALEMISATMRNANEQKSSMLELKKQTQISSDKLKERQREIQQELSEVEPILAEASTAVGQIKSEALSEIRSLRAPPEAVRDILEGVLRLMGIRDTSWNSMKTFLAKRGVKEDICCLDPGRINPENCDAVVKLLANKADSFEMKNAKRASAAAAPLAAWVKANVRYAKVLQSIAPLEREQKELQGNLDEAEGELKSLITGLDDVDNRVKQLSAKLNAYTQEAAVLELKLQDARGTLQAAEVLVEKLSAEFHTWSRQLDEYKASYKTLDTKSLIIALAINYLSHLSLDRRSIVLGRLSSEMQLAGSVEVRKNLITEQEQIIWESMGLARDAQIIENAALLRKMLELPFGSYPLPLVLDPTQAAFGWLEEYLRSKNIAFESTTQNNERLSYSLELAVRFGKILLVQDCHEVRPPLMQLCLGRIQAKFNKRQVAIGSKMVDVHEQFRLVLFTKAARISIEPETLAHLTCLPFTVTAVGLTDQLMSRAIILKNPELEQKRIELLKREGVLLQQRIELEDKLLEELSSAQGDVLKNEKLLQTLNEVKESSSFIDKSLKESSRVKETLLEEFTQLKDLCSKAATFYKGLTHTYEIAVMVYIKLFLNSLSSYEGKSEQKVYEELVRSTFKYLARSTARSSLQSLALSVCRNAYPETVPENEWELFITNFMSSSEMATPLTASGPPFPDYINKEAAAKLLMLFQAAPNLKAEVDFERDSKSWRQLLSEGYLHQMPGQIASTFHRVLLMQILRPDLMMQQLRATTADLLGISSDNIAQPTVDQLVEESSADKPILMITQAENDPATEIKSCATRKVGLDKYRELSIGKGMERRALDEIRQAAEKGMWICVKNIHLVPHWLTELERELELLQKAAAFRLWLVCESTAGLNESIMYKFVKVLYEFPNGLKLKVRRMLQNYSSQGGREQLKDAKSLKMRIAVFIATACLQERRKYIPQGWSKYYDFGEADLKAALDVLRWQDSSMASGRPDWQLMRRLCENVAFGGRINNARDLQVLQGYLEQFCSADVLNNRWTPLNMRVAVPTSLQLADYVQAIDKFPDVDEPETFGLSNDSNRSREIEHSREILRELRASYYRNADDDKAVGEGSEGVTQKLEKQIKPILTLWRKLAGKCSVAKTAKELESGSLGITPWQFFVCSELKIGAVGFLEVHNTLAQVHGWLKESLGQANANVDSELLKTLAENQVPSKWRMIWPGPQTVVDYLRAFVERAQAAESRYRSEYEEEFCSRIDFACIFNADNLLACLKLTNAQRGGLSCKDLTLHTQLLAADAADAPQQNTNFVAVVVAPLKIDGGTFSNNKLVLSSTAGDRDKKTPSFLLTYKPKPQEDKNTKYSVGTTPLPLYTNRSREKLIAMLHIPCNESPEKLLFSGAALIVPDY